MLDPSSVRGDTVTGLSDTVGCSVSVFLMAITFCELSLLFLKNFVRNAIFTNILETASHFAVFPGLCRSGNKFMKRL